MRIPIIARLKANLPSLLLQAEQRFHLHPPSDRFQEEQDTFELWDESFPPWETLEWTSVRVLRYRQTKPDGTVIEAMWLTNIAKNIMGSRSLTRAAKSRWEIENEGFNVAKNQYNLAVIRHHHQNSMLVQWLLTFLAINIERLYRIRFLHRGAHPIMESIALWNALWFSLELRARRRIRAPG
jgi:predicted nicotinamide N-methyase